MKNIHKLSALLTLLMLFFNLHPSYAEKNRNDKILEDIQYLEKLYPCTENSENEKKVYSYIRNRLDSLSVSYYEENLDLLPDIHSFSSNIIIDFKGKKDKTIIFAVPVNNLSDSSFNVANALSLTEELMNSTPNLNCRILFLGAEYSDDEDPGYPAGSRQFLDTFFPENDTALIYINLSSSASDIDIIHGSREDVTPLWFLKQIIDSMSAGGIDCRINTQENILYQLGYDSEAPYDIYLKNNIPALALESTKKNIRKNNRTDNIIKFRNFLSTIPENQEIKSEEDWDSHYFMLQMPGKTIIISEYSFILFYITTVGLLIVFSVFSGKKVLRYSKKLLKYVWIVLYFFILIFIFLLISTLITVFITTMKSSYEIWRESPFYLLTLKILISVLLFFFSLFLLKKIKLTVSGSFYSAGAIFLFLINLIIFQFINITLALFALWGLFWTILFSLFKSRVLKTACMFLSSAFIIYIVFYIFSKPAYDLCEKMIFDWITGNILITFVILPYIMMILRILISRTHIESAKYRALRRTIYSATALLFIFLLNYYMKNNPFPAGNPQPVFYRQTVDLNRKISTVTIKSPYKTGRISYFSGEKEYTADTEKTFYKASSATSLDLMSVSRKTSSYLDRKNLIFEIEAAGNPEKYYIDFFTKEDPVVLDCSYPFTVTKNSNKGTIHIGKNPPSPLVIDMLLPENTSVWFNIRTVSETFPFDNKLKGKNKLFRQQFEIIKGIDG